VFPQCPVKDPADKGLQEMLAKQTNAENIFEGEGVRVHCQFPRTETYLSCSSPFAQGADYNLDMVNPQQLPAE